MGGLSAFYINILYQQNLSTIIHKLLIIKESPNTMERQFFIGKILVNFYLRNPKSSKPTMIYMVVRFDKKNYAFSTKAKVYPYQWDKNVQEAICDIGLCRLDNLNNMKANNTIAAFKEKIYHLKTFLCDNPQEIVSLPRLLTEMFAIRMGRKKKVHPINA